MGSHDSRPNAYFTGFCARGCAPCAFETVCRARKDVKLNRKLNHAISLEIDDVIDSIFTSDGKSTLSYSIPLPQIIDILTDLWEADGLYD